MTPSEPTRPDIPVHLARAAAYAATDLDRLVAELLHAAGLRPRPGERVLVKPNLVAARGAPLSTTEPAMVRAACLYLLECGAVVSVADSPAFGTARGVARACGLLDALAGLPLRVTGLGRPAALRLSFGASVSVSRDALEADAILSLPRVKVHNQLRLSLAVKNLFGCVVGGRKALAHCRFGDKGERFEAMILDVAAALPRTFGLADGIVAMHRRGPTGGEPFSLGLVGAAADIHALDCALYAVLKACPEKTAIWRLARKRGLPGAFSKNLAFPLLAPDVFDADGFIIPETLDPVTFDPLRLVKGRVKSLCQRFF